MRLWHLPTTRRSRPRPTVAAPTLIARKPGERIKTDRRDSQKLALQHRFGDLTEVWVPDPVHEAIRDLVRARMEAVMQLMRARQQCLAFLLRHGRNYGPGKKNWTLLHRRWLATQKFDQTTHQIVFQDYVEAVWSAQDRRDQLEARISEMLSDWSMVPLGETFKQEFGQDIRDLWDADDISLENFTQSIHRDVRSVRTSRGTPRPAQ